MGVYEQISIHALLAESDSEIGVPIPALPHDFYPRSPCGERLTSPKSVIYLLDISIHALLAESDPAAVPCCPNAHISIHALLAESDGTVLVLQCVLGNFYPRSPCGERPVAASTSDVSERISIHALLAESDTPRTYQQGERRAFLSTLSLRRATRLMYFWRFGRLFLSTLSLRRATWFCDYF